MPRRMVSSWRPVALHLGLVCGLAAVVTTCTPHATVPAEAAPAASGTAETAAPTASAPPVLTESGSTTGDDSAGDDSTGDDDPKVPGLAPLDAEEPLVSLEVAEHEAAVVSLPLGATERRPVLVATHGNYDRPGWTCAIWRNIVENDGFVVCPRGVKRSDSRFPGDPRFHYLTNAHLEREIEAALAALVERFGEYVAAPPHVFAGFSQGAIMGVPIIGRRPEWFDRAVLIEGGFDRWSQASVTAFAAAGGKRVLFACGQWACDHGGKSAGRWFEAAGIESRVVFAKGAGHTYGGEIAELVAGAWSWVVAEDERWTGRPTPDTPND